VKIEENSKALNTLAQRLQGSKSIKGDETSEECDRGWNSNSCKSKHQHGNYNNMPTLISFQGFFLFLSSFYIQK
jgi:hypothetical protein